MIALAACSPSSAPADSAPRDSSADHDERGDDSGFDASADSGARDGDVASDGGTCSIYRGNDSWTAALAVASGARLCAYAARQWSIETGETLEQMKQRLLLRGFESKSTIAVSPGRHALPTMSESRAFLLPMCIEDRGVATGPAAAATRVTVSEGLGIGSTPDGPTVESEFALGAQTLQVRINRTASDGNTASLVARQTEHYRGVNITRGDRLYANCGLIANRCTNITLGTMGSLRMDEYNWQAMPGFGFATPLRLTGMLNGTRVDVTAYEGMVGIYTRHAFERVNVFRFARPVDGACALRVDISDLGSPIAVTLADCNGVPLGRSIATTSATTPCS